MGPLLDNDSIKGTSFLVLAFMNKMGLACPVFEYDSKEESIAFVAGNNYAISISCCISVFQVFPVLFL